MRYILGVDGGAVKTHCALYDADTGRLDMLVCGPCIPEGGALRTLLRDALRLLLARSNISMSDIEFGALGLNGFNTPEQHRLVSDILLELGLEKFSLHDNMALGIRAGTRGGVGICAVNDDGFCVTGMDSSGRLAKIGGLLAYSGDFGGIRTLTSHAVGLVYGQLFRDEPFTELTTEMFRWIDTTDKHDFMTQIMERLRCGFEQTTAELCKILFQTAALGDAAATALLDKSAACYAGAITGAISELCFSEPVEVVFAGSVFARSDCDYMKVKIEEQVRKRFPSTVFESLTAPCVSGAVLWALCNIGLDGERDNVLRGFGRRIFL